MQQEKEERTEDEKTGRAHLNEQMLMEMLEEITDEKERLAEECAENGEQFKALQQKYQDLRGNFQAVSEQNQTLQKKSRRRMWGTAAALLLALAGLGGTVYFGMEKNYYQDRYHYERSKCTEAEAEQKVLQDAYQQVQDAYGELQVKYEKLGVLDGLYGYGSENYYSDRGIVVLKTGETESIQIHAEAGEKYYLKTSSDGINCEWKEKAMSFLFGIAQPLPTVSDVGGEVSIEAKTAGVYTIFFRNRENDDTFEVLVVVADDANEESQKTSVKQSIPTS